MQMMNHLSEYIISFILLAKTLIPVFMFVFPSSHAEETPVATVVPNGEIHSEKEAKDLEPSKRLSEPSERPRAQRISDSVDANQQVTNLFQGKLVDASLFGSWFREFVIRSCSSLKSQGNLSLAVAIIFFVILLMQVWCFNMIHNVLFLCFGRWTKLIKTSIKLINVLDEYLVFAICKLKSCLDRVFHKESCCVWPVPIFRNFSRVSMFCITDYVNLGRPC